MLLKIANTGASIDIYRTDKGVTIMPGTNFDFADSENMAGLNMLMESVSTGQIDIPLEKSAVIAAPNSQQPTTTQPQTPEASPQFVTMDQYQQLQQQVQQLTQAMQQMMPQQPPQPQAPAPQAPAPQAPQPQPQAKQARRGLAG